VAHRFRTIDFALPAALAVAAVVALLPDPVPDAPAPVPVRGTIADPCSGEELVFGGTADVRASAAPNGAGGYDVQVHAELSEATATSRSGQPYDLGGLVSGNAEAGAPFPVTVEVVASGVVLGGGPLGDFGVRLRIPVSVGDRGEVAPTGAAEVVQLACKMREPVDAPRSPQAPPPLHLTR
jgi:hypothetical protein